MRHAVDAASDDWRMVWRSVEILDVLRRHLRGHHFDMVNGRASLGALHAAHSIHHWPHILRSPA